MNKNELDYILENHKKFMRCESDGNRADLSEADLRGADLSGADLRGADLRRADLSGADLRGATLSGADLSGADLSRATLSGADLRGADGIISFGPIGHESRIGYANIRDGTTIIHLGCHAAPLAETLTAIEKKYGLDSTYAALVIAAARELEGHMENKP